MIDEPMKSPEDDEPEEKVGYGRPPRQHQFKPGKSGNPRGRPKGAKGLKAELLAAINEPVTITVNGKPKRMRTLSLVLKSLATQAAKGKIGAQRELITRVIEAFGLEDERPTAKELSDTDRLILARFLGEEPTHAGMEVDDGSKGPTGAA
jgi:hypothetical protein